MIIKILLGFLALKKDVKQCLPQNVKPFMQQSDNKDILLADLNFNFCEVYTSFFRTFKEPIPIKCHLCLSKS